MEIKAKKVIGLKVISIQGGTQIQDVNDVIFDPRNNKIRALLVDEGGLFKDAKVILYEDIKSIGDDAVMVENPSVIKKVSDIEDRVSAIAKDDEYLTKTKVLTEDGKELGSVTDIAFDTSTGDVTRFIVSNGLFNNIASGEKSFTKSDIVTVGHDATIVRSFTEDKFDEQAKEQGLQGAFNKTKEKAVDLSGGVKDKVSEAGSNVNETMKDPNTQEQFKQTAVDMKDTAVDGFNKAKDFVTEKFSESKDKVMETRIKNAMGMYLDKNIILQNGTLERGKMIDNSVIEKADEAGMLEQVLNNAVKEPPMSTVNSVSGLSGGYL